MIYHAEMEADMNKTTVTMPSVTHAIKAKRALARGGVSSVIRRSPKVSENGCTHLLIVNGDTQSVIAFFNRNGIEYGKVLSSTGSRL